MLACLDGCRFVRVPDLQPSAVVGFLADLRKPNGHRWQMSGTGKSIATANHYLTAVEGFHPLAVAGSPDRRDPLGRPCRSWRTGKPTFATPGATSPRKNWPAFWTPPAKAEGHSAAWPVSTVRLYLTAAGLASGFPSWPALTPASFDLDARPANRRVQRRVLKNRKEAVQPLPPELADGPARLPGRQARRVNRSGPASGT